MLPYIAIPLTAGTGSEVTPYAIITDLEREMKRNLSTPTSFPVVAFLDPRYTASMSLAITRNTGIDALSHAIEGFVSRRATIISDLLALEAIRLFREALPALQAGQLTLRDRSTLLYSSLLAGMVITQTGTCLVHALGYNLTINHGVPHGAANGYLLGPFLEFLEETIPEKTDQILKALGLDFTWQVNPLFAPLLPEKKFSLSPRELELYAKNTLEAKGTGFTPRLPLKEDVERILLQMA